MHADDAVRVRPIEPQDADEVARVHADCWLGTYVGYVPDQVASERIVRARQRDWVEQRQMRIETGGGVLVAASAERVLGFCEFGPTEDADEEPSTVGHIMRLYVEPPSQGRGAGRLLLQRACEHLGAAGHRSVTLWTPEPSWNRARGFYEHLGWKPEEVFNGDNPPDIRYRLRLVR